MPVDERCLVSLRSKGKRGGRLVLDQGRRFGRGCRYAGGGREWRRKAVSTWWLVENLGMSGRAGGSDKPVLPI